MTVPCRVAPLLPEFGRIVRRVVDLDDRYFESRDGLTESAYRAGMSKADQTLKALETAIMMTPATSPAGLATQLAIAAADAVTLHAWSSDEEASSPYFRRLSASLKHMLDAIGTAEADTAVIEFYTGRRVEAGDPKPAPKDVPPPAARGSKRTPHVRAPS